MRSSDPTWTVDDSCHGRLLGLADDLAQGRFRHLEDLASLDRRNFYTWNGGSSYGQAALAVRFFLDGEDGALREGFRAFLRDVAEEKLATPKLLQRHPGRSWEELDAGFLRFVRAQLARY